MASVKKRKDSPYWVACYRLPNGERRQRSTRFMDAKFALALAKELEKPYHTKTQKHVVDRLLSDVQAVELDYHYQVFENTRPVKVLRVKPPALVCGVYFLFWDGRCVYVGQSVNVHARLMQHRAVKEYDYADIIPVPPEKLAEVERHYIALIKPEWNRTQHGLCAQG